jgi:5-methylcytosine-specific restriction endonuclease McrA
MGGEFYWTREWRAVRYETLRKYGAKCSCCGRGTDHGMIMHVDHIKPRSKFPELELDPTNLQVLCEACNEGKSNTDNTDWRRK